MKRTFEFYYKYDDIRFVDNFISSASGVNRVDGLFVKKHNKDSILQISCSSLDGIACVINLTSCFNHRENIHGSFCRSLRQAIENWIG